MEYKDYYQTLGVSRDATAEQIKQAYRKLARKYHPDVSKEKNAEVLFKEVGEAYEVLKDGEKRAAYDKFGANWRNGDPFEPPPGWNAGSTSHGDGKTGAGAADFSDFFESLFGRDHGGGTHRQQSFHMQGEDHHAKIVIRLVDAYHGARQSITLTRPTMAANGQVTMTPHQLHVVIPKGITAGQRIRLEGQGMPGYGGAPAGDLFLEIAFESDPLFRAEKRTIHLTLPVTPWEAVLGVTLTVPTLGGNVQLKIPPGSQDGRKLRLKGKGLSSRTSEGDQIVTLHIVQPEVHTEEQRQLYETMAKLMPFNPRAAMGI